jgi:hypothetical protein
LLIVACFVVVSCPSSIVKWITNQKKIRRYVFVDKNFAFITAAVIPWVIRHGEISTFQMQKMTYLDEYFSPVIRSRNVYCIFEPIKMDVRDAG